MAMEKYRMVQSTDAVYYCKVSSRQTDGAGRGDASVPDPRSAIVYRTVHRTVSFVDVVLTPSSQSYRLIAITVGISVIR
jgi:hypothetical protein